MISPVQGSVLPNPTQTFTWTTFPTATRYSLWVGTTLGSTNLLNFLPTTATSATATNIPMNGKTVYVRLFSMINNVWQALDYTYIGGVTAKAAMISPTPGSTTTGGRATFTWSTGSAVTQYSLWIGNTLGGTNLLNFLTTGTSVTATNLPKNGRTIYVRLWSMINTVWQYTDYTYVAGP